MKKLLSICALGLLLFGITSAATGDLWSWMDNLNDEIPFGYAVSQKISVDQITTSKIVIKSPVIEDELGNQIKKYTVMYSQYPLSQILDNVALLDQSKEKTFDFTTLLATGITMELNSIADGINPNVVYYISVIPKDQNGILWEISNELRFKLATQTSGEGTPPSQATGHAAAGANMSLANVTCPITANKAVCSWTAIDGSDKVDIFLWNPTSQVFERLASVNMSDEKYEFTLTRNGEYIVNFMPNNWWTEYRLTFVANGVVAVVTPAKPWTKPVIGKIPATGPKENVLIALGIAVVLYVAYRKMRTKAKR